MSDESASPILEGIGLTKRFGGITAVDHVDIRIFGGEVLGIVGDNGAGKSTVVGMLSGRLEPDEGTLELEGTPVTLKTPQDARAAGLETVWQDLALAKDLDIGANVFLGRELVHPILPRLIAPMRQRAMHDEALTMLASVGIAVRTARGEPVETLSGGQLQAVAVARSAAWASKIVFMDEPTAALGVRQSAIVYAMCRTLAERDIGVVLVSHSISSVVNVTDRVVVLRHGRKVADMNSGEFTAERIVALITGERGRP